MKGRHNILYLYVVGTLVIKRGMEGGAIASIFFAFLGMNCISLCRDRLPNAQLFR